MTLFEFFFSAEQPATLVLNPLIWGITLLALAQVAAAIRSAAVRLKGDLDALDVDDLTAADAKADELVARSRTLDRESPVRSRIESLDALRQRAEPIDSEILAAISAEEFRDSAPVARWAMSVLVLLGLAGTLVGLGLAVSDLSSLLAPSEGRGTLNSGQIVEAILATLGDMRVAFSTTLSGVFGAVVVGSGLAWLRHAQSLQIQRMERLSSTHWQPLFQTSEQTRLTDAVRELEAVRGGMTDAVGELEEMRKKVGLLVDRNLEVLGSREEGDPTLTEYVRSVRATTDELQNAVESVSGLLPEMEESLKRTIEAEHESLSGALVAHTSMVEPLLQRQQQAAEALTKAVTGELDRINEIRDVLERLNASFEGARGTWERADQAIARMEQSTAGALRDGFRDALSAVARLTEEQARSQQRVTEALDAFQSTNRQTMERLADASNRALNHSQEVVTEIRRTLKESLDRVGERLLESQRGASDQVATGLSRLGRELRDLSGPSNSGSEGLGHAGGVTNVRDTATAVPDAESVSANAPRVGGGSAPPPTPEVVLDDLEQGD